jgi:hypothetical protein
MPLSLAPLGTLTVHVERSWNFAQGPLGGRSCSAFREVVWEGDALSARSLWANGTYRNGPTIAEPHIRALLRDDAGVLLYLDYVARIELASHIEGRSPAMMSGRIEVDDAVARYAWLNRTQVVGRGMLDMRAMTQTYETYALRSE